MQECQCECYISQRVYLNLSFDASHNHLPMIMSIANCWNIFNQIIFNENHCCKKS